MRMGCRKRRHVWKLENITHDFCTGLAPINSLEESTLAAESQSQSADFRQSDLTDFTENQVVYISFRLISSSRMISNILDILNILEHVFICHARQIFCISLLCSDKVW